MRAKFKRFCVGAVLAGLVLAWVVIAQAIPPVVQLGAALVGFGAALATLGGVGLWLFDYARNQ